MPNFQTIKNFQKALNDITIMNLQIVLNTTTKTYLNQATNKEYLLKFSYLKNPKIENVKPKKSFDHPSDHVTWNWSIPL